MRSTYYLLVTVLFNVRKAIFGERTGCMYGFDGRARRSDGREGAEGPSVGREGRWRTVSRRGSILPYI